MMFSASVVIVLLLLLCRYFYCGANSDALDKRAFILSTSKAERELGKGAA
jgi:hypothetical protein